MSNPEGALPEDPAKSAPPVADAPPHDEVAGFGVSAIVRRWRRDDLVRRGSLALRALALVFSLLAFLIMVTNKHGGWKDFDKYQEFRSFVFQLVVL